MAQNAGIFVLLTIVLSSLTLGLIAAGYAAKRTAKIALRPIGVGILAFIAVLTCGTAALLILNLASTVEEGEETSGLAHSTGDFRGTPVPKAHGMGEDDSCWYAEQVVTSRSVVNIPQWSFHQRVDWCGDGTRIVGDPEQAVSWDTHLPLWTFEGYLDVSESQSGTDRYFAYSQAKFRFCTIPLAVCVTHDYPWIDMTVFGNGTFSVEVYGG